MLYLGPSYPRNVGHTEIHNFITPLLKTTQNYETKLRIFILYVKREVLGWSFLVGGVHKLRRNK